MPCFPLRPGPPADFSMFKRGEAHAQSAERRCFRAQLGQNVDSTRDGRQARCNGRAVPVSGLHIAQQTGDALPSLADIVRSDGSQIERTMVLRGGGSAPRLRHHATALS